MEDKLKAGVIKLWEQCCEKNSPKIIKLDKGYTIKEDVKISLLSEFITKKLKESFKYVSFLGTNTKMSEWSYDLSHINYFKIGKKILGIYKLDLDKLKIENNWYLPNNKVNIPNASEFNKFLRNYDLNHLTIVSFKPYADYYLCDARMYIISYNNIFIPITENEYIDLKNYEPRCRMRDDLEDIYRNLTLLTSSEYREFIMWKEAENKKIDISKTILELNEQS